MVSKIEFSEGLNKTRKQKRVEVRMLTPGRQSREMVKIALVSGLILLTVLSSIGNWLPVLVNGFGSMFSSPSLTSQSSANSTSTSKSLGNEFPQGVGASPLPDLSLPKTIVSSVASLVDDGGVIQASPQDLILYNLAVSMRLLGGPVPHDELLGPSDRTLSSWSFWSVQANATGHLIPLAPTSNSFTILGTNSSGTTVLRTMHLSSGLYSGDFKITYKATSHGTLKWSLSFTPNVIGEYQLVYTWRNLTQNPLLKPESKSFSVGYLQGNYTLSWDDVPSILIVKPTLSTNHFSLAINLGTIADGAEVKIDPTIASNVSNVATYPTFERKVFYDAQNGYYFAFYYDGRHVGYSSSHDGVNWSSQQPMPSNWPTYLGSGYAPSYQPAVLNQGQQVFVTSGEVNVASSSCPFPICNSPSISAHVYYAVGTISGGSINWQNSNQAYVLVSSSPVYCVGQYQTCTISVGYRYANLALSSRGNLTATYNWFLSDQKDADVCSASGGNYQQSTLYFSYGRSQLNVASDQGCGSSVVSTNQDMSILVPADSNGKVQIIYHFEGESSAPSLDTEWYDGSSTGGNVVLRPTVLDNDQFSAVADANYGIHLLYQMSDGTVSYDYQPSISSGWSPATPNIFGQSATSPTVTADYSTNDIYALGVVSNANGNSVTMMRKPLSQNWSDQIATYQITGRKTSCFLTSNAISASATNASQIQLIWTEGGVGPYNVTFASIPIETVWSPYAVPSLPWDGNGLAPYGQYFENLGEYVSANTGLLTLRQTDLSVPGRGLNLDITRVYTEPYSFLGGSPFNFEKYPWAPLGDGWQLNYPWMNNTVHPLYIHLWNGEGYRIPSSFWTGAASIFENHQGENFRLARNADGSISLYDKTATLYYFNTTIHKLARITDSTGNNAITFSYNGNMISCITDTVGRAFTFSYSNGLLQSIGQMTGSCSRPGTLVTVISYAYNVQSLVSMTDPAQRITSYSYNATTGSVAPWLLSRIRYPTSWLTNYTYTQVPLGTTAFTYRVTLQKTGPSSVSPVRQFAYAYSHTVDDQVTNSTVTTYNGTSIVRYTLYAFSFAGVSRNITDSNHSFVRGIVQRFGVNGEVPREIVLVSPTTGYINYYSYDLWGNLIYSRTTISSTPSRFRESFSSYYNDGLSPGFSAFQETFSESNFTLPDHAWSNVNGTWLVKNGVYNGTSPVFNPVHQEQMFAWVNMSVSNVSILASVYITKPMISSDGRVGLIAHYPGSGLRKWGLVLHNSTSGMKLSLLDEYVTWKAENSCTLSYNTWYRFNFTISGSQAWGSATAPGISPCSVSGNFTSTDITAATGVGLYAGGYSALFDNVTITTVAPGITGTIFSNSFIPNGAPNSNIHGSLAGTAEFQNGTGSAPVETYYSYFSWDGLNNVKRLSSSSGGAQWLTTTTTYDAFGNPVTTIDAQGNYTYYAYSGMYGNAYLTNQTQVLKPGSTGITRLYSYNFTTGTMLSSVEPNGYNTTYRYDILGRVTRVNYPNNSGYTMYSYNDPANYVNVTNSNLWLTQNVYDGIGRLAKVQRYTGGTNGGTPYSNQTYTHNWQDQIVNQKDTFGNVYNYTYDPLGRLTQTRKPDGNITEVSYNDVSSYVVYTDEYLNRRCNTYDRLGRLLSVVEYSDSNCNPISLSGSSYVTNYNYDEVSNLRKVVTANSKTTTYSYDSLNRLTQTNYPDGTLESYSYDNGGNMVSKTDRNSVQTSYAYDSLNRVLSISYHATTVPAENYTYDKNGNLLQLASQNATLSCTYDIRNRVTCERYAVNGATSISGPCGTGGGGGSVAAGTLITLANGTLVPVQRLSVGMKLLSYNVTSSSYAATTITSLVTVDTDNMLVIRTQNPTPLRVDNATAQKLWVKTADGTIGWLSVAQLRTGDSLFLPLSQQWTMVTSIEKATGGNHIMYDIYTTSLADYIADGYLDPVKQGPTLPTPPGKVSVGYSFTYTYSGDTLSQITYNDMDVVTYAYDGLGRVLNVTQSPVSPFLLVKLSYYRNGQVSNMTYGSGVKATYTFDKVARPLNITYYASKQLLSLAYSYNKTGTVASVFGQVNGTSVNELYRYDALLRLTNATITNGGPTTALWYQYDSAGNRIRQNGIGLTNSSYNLANNELLKTTQYLAGHYSTTASYAYDLDGNIFSENVTSLAPPAHWTYGWNVEGDLVKVSNYTSIQGYYAYDGLGRGVEAKEGSSTTFYAYSGTETLAEQIPGGAATDYVYADGMRIGRTGSSISTRFYVTDALGSTRLVTDTTGKVIFSDNYQPYGTDNASNGSETYKFTGKPVSQTTGLYYEYQRWYDPSIGRFISQDPLPGHKSNPQTLNPYVYVLNSPTSQTDPSGMCAGGFLGPFDTYVACPYLNWFNNSVEAPVLTWEIGGNQAVAQEALNKSSELEVTLFDAGVVASAAVVACIVACPAIATALGFGGSSSIAGTGATTIASACSVDEQACQVGADALTKDVVDLGSTGAATDDVQLSSYFLRGRHLYDIGKAITGYGGDTEGTESLIANTLQTGEFNGARSSEYFWTYEQLYGNPITGEPVGLRVIWDVLNQEVRNAYPFGVPLS